VVRSSWEIEKASFLVTKVQFKTPFQASQGREIATNFEVVKTALKNLLRTPNASGAVSPQYSSDKSKLHR
jgi:predicted transposase YbfD/YdcC